MGGLLRARNFHGHFAWYCCCHKFLSMLFQVGAPHDCGNVFSNYEKQALLLDFSHFLFFLSKTTRIVFMYLPVNFKGNFCWLVVEIYYDQE